MKQLLRFFILISLGIFLFVGLLRLCMLLTTQDAVSSLDTVTTSSEVISDLTDVITKVPIIWISPPIIPNLNLSVSTQMELPLQNRISEYLRDFSREEIGKSLLSQMLDYEIAQLEPLHDSSFQPLRDLLATTNVRLADLAR